MPRALLPLALSLAACQPTRAPDPPPASQPAATAQPAAPSTTASASPLGSGLVPVPASAPRGVSHALGASQGGLKIKDLIVGEGATAAPGRVVRVHYTGTLPDGTVFDETLSRGQPIELPLGRGSLIKGWEQGIPGMRVGGKRELVIPPELGYGPGGRPPKIPPGTDLIFEIDLLEVR